MPPQPALRAGDWRDLDAAPGVFAWERRHGGDRRVCAVNFASAPRTIALVGDWRVEAGTHRTQAGAAFDGRLAADEAVVLRPD